MDTEVIAVRQSLRLPGPLSLILFSTSYHLCWNAILYIPKFYALGARIAITTAKMPTEWINSALDPTIPAITTQMAAIVAIIDVQTSSLSRENKFCTG
jgi:hypothetical protein